MSISTFNFQFYNYKLPAALPVMAASSFSELEMDIDEEEMATSAITSTPLPAAKEQTRPRFTSELSLAITNPDVSSPKPLAKPLQALRPQLHKSQKRWSMELREKVLEMSKRNNASDVEEQQPSLNSTFTTNSEPEVNSANDETTRSVTDKINFFNKLTNTFESARSLGQNTNNNNNNRFISLLRSSRPLSVASISANGQVPPPKPKRLSATPVADPMPHQFATPIAKAPIALSNNNNNNTIQRKCSLRRKPSMEKSRATIARQNSNATLRPQRHAMMEDLSLVVPVRLRIAEYEQRISMSA